MNDDNASKATEEFTKSTFEFKSRGLPRNHRPGDALRMGR